MRTERIGQGDECYAQETGFKSGVVRKMLEKYGLKETADVIRFVRSLSFDQLPMDVVQKAKYCILDTIGCSLVGRAATENTRILVDLLKGLGGTPEATFFGDGFRTTAMHAALANGTSAHSLDLDDTHRGCSFHVGAGSIPAVFALAEKLGSSGQEIITATVAAYEVSIRLALAVYPSLKLRGFHLTGTCGTFGGAVGAGKILQLNEEQLVNAFGLAGTQAAGIFQFIDDGDMSKRLHPGKSASNGVFSALLAQRGYTGPYRVWEGRYGFPAVLAGEYKPEIMREGLGQKYRIMEVGFKIHAACRYTNTPIDATLMLVNQYGIKPEDILKGEIKACKISADQIKKKDIQTLLDAQMSGPFSVALAIVHKRAGYTDYMSGIKEDAVLELTKKFDMVEEPRFGLADRTAIVEIQTKDGKKYSQEANLPKGEPEVPLTKEEIEAKFMDLGSTALASEKVQRAMEIMNNLEHLKDVRELVKNLVP
ncbi:MmgE/PrpD family protein [bacterium]|nr:MAG: MmgE/PrpD family protein [bacterium]